MMHWDPVPLDGEVLVYVVIQVLNNMRTPLSIRIVESTDFISKELLWRS